MKKTILTAIAFGLFAVNVSAAVTSRTFNIKGEQVTVVADAEKTHEDIYGDGLALNNVTLHYQGAAYYLLLTGDENTLAKKVCQAYGIKHPAVGTEELSSWFSQPALYINQFDDLTINDQSDLKMYVKTLNCFNYRYLYPVLDADISTMVLEITSLFRLVHPVVMQAIHITNWCIDKLLWFNIV